MSGAPKYPAATIAKLLMISEKQLRRLSSDGIVPSAEAGQYELAPAVQGFIRYLREGPGAAATHQEVAAHLGVDRARITELVGKGVLPRDGRRLNLDACRTAYIEHLREIAAGRAGDGVHDLVGERARKAKEEADALEMRNAQLRRELLAREDVDAAVTAAFARVKARLLAIPSKVAPRVLGLDLRAIAERLRVAIEDALHELADTTVADLCGDHGELVGDAQASAEADDQRVGRPRKKAKP